MQYTGRENDGAGLYYYRARYYDPLLKRFLSEDPIGIAGSLNVYGYAGGNPVNLIDPTGNSTCYSQGPGCCGAGAPGGIFKTPAGGGCFTPIWAGGAIVGWDPCKTEPENRPTPATPQACPAKLPPDDNPPVPPQPPAGTPPTSGPPYPLTAPCHDICMADAREHMMYHMLRDIGFHVAMEGLLELAEKKEFITRTFGKTVARAALLGGAAFHRRLYGCECAAMRGAQMTAAGGAHG